MRLVARMRECHTVPEPPDAAYFHVFKACKAARASRALLDVLLTMREEGIQPGAPLFDIVLECCTPGAVLTTPFPSTGVLPQRLVRTSLRLLEGMMFIHRSCLSCGSSACFDR